MFDYLGLEALVAVAKEGSFIKAAKVLFVTQSAISQRIRTLEESVGKPLLVRTTPIQPTEAGQQLILHYQQVRLLEKSLKSKWSPPKEAIDPTPFSIALNTESLSTWFIKAMDSIVKQEDIIIHLFVEDQEKTQRFLKEGKVLGCVTSIAQAPFGCESTFLGFMIYCCVATPDFKKRFFSRGINSKTLLKAPAVIYGETDKMHGDYLGSHFRAYKKGIPCLYYIPSPQGLIEFTLKGLAYALLPLPSIQSHLGDKRLVDLLPGKPYLLPLYWQFPVFQTEIEKRVSKNIVTQAKLVLKQ